MTTDTLETIHGLIMGIIGVQVAYCYLILILGNIIYDYYEMSVFQNSTNIFQKMLNFIVKLYFGIAPYIYRKFLKFPWILRKLYMLIASIGITIISIPIYYIIKFVLDFVLLKIF